MTLHRPGLFALVLVAAEDDMIETDSLADRFLDGELSSVGQFALAERLAGNADERRRAMVA